MVKYGEDSSLLLRFRAAPDFLGKVSFLTAGPRSRSHASLDVDNVEDLRLKMCIQITGEDFYDPYELGHNFYQRAYNKPPPTFRDSANDGFHEAVGDTIAPPSRLSTW
jgi:peptidyl-dipeptidase A